MLPKAIPNRIDKWKPFFQIQKRFAYYRFHKRVGKGSWTKYIERYQLPRSIENTQRLIFNYKPTFSEAKLSCSWLWNLPKKIALATTTDEVLNVWVYYRHKRKKSYHFFQVLKRLVELGNCSITDWRFQLIISRIENKINVFLNLPRICFYLGKLKATTALQNMTKMINNRLSSYMPHQSLLLLKAFALCHLQDKYLFNRIRDMLKPQIETLPFYYLKIIIESYSSCLIHDYLFMNFLANEIIYRINLCVEKESTEENTNAISKWKYVNGIIIKNQQLLHKNEKEDSHNLSKQEKAVEEKEKDEMETIIEKENNAFLEEEEQLLKYKQEQFNYYPTIKNLIDIAEYFSILKFQNYVFYDHISTLIIYLLKYNNCLSPFLLEKAILSFYKIKINDIKMYEHILKHIDTYIYSYPPSVLCSIGYCLSSILPCYYSPIYKIMKRMIQYIKEHMDILSLDHLSKLSSFVHKIKNLNQELQKEILFQINEELKKNERKNSKTVYDISRLIEVLSFHDLIDVTSFSVLCKHLLFHLKHFEPFDFSRTLRALETLKKKKNLNDDKIINAIARDVIKQHDVFHVIDYHQVAKALLGMDGIKDVYKINLIKHHSSTSFYNFEELKLNTEIPKEVKKSLNRYKKGTIYYSKKKIMQQFPLYKSIED